MRGQNIKGRGRRRGGFTLTESDGLLPGDNVGNRKSFKDVSIPSDDMGNRKENGVMEDFVPDYIGNSLNNAPTHLNSGILASVEGRRRKKAKYDEYEDTSELVYREPAAEPVSSRSEQSRQQNGAFQKTQSDSRGRRNFHERTNRYNQERPTTGPFDFDEDERFEYVLKSDPEVKRKAAFDTVQQILEHAKCDATVEAKLLKHEDKYTVLVTVEELTGEGQAPLLTRGNMAMTALNFLVNKVVNRYPDDRIRLSVVMKPDEPAYLTELDAYHERLKQQKEQNPKAKAVTSEEYVTLENSEVKDENV